MGQEMNCKKMGRVVNWWKNENCMNAKIYDLARVTHTERKSWWRKLKKIANVIYYEELIIWIIKGSKTLKKCNNK